VRFSLFSLFVRGNNVVRSDIAGPQALDTNSDPQRVVERITTSFGGVTAIHDEPGHIVRDHNSNISAKISPNRRRQVGI
jgi:hypothetical protein